MWVLYNYIQRMKQCWRLYKLPLPLPNSVTHSKIVILGFWMERTSLICHEMVNCNDTGISGKECHQPVFVENVWFVDLIGKLCWSDRVKYTLTLQDTSAFFVSEYGMSYPPYSSDMPRMNCPIFRSKLLFFF